MSIYKLIIAIASFFLVIVLLQSCSVVSNQKKEQLKSIVENYCHLNCSESYHSNEVDITFYNGFDGALKIFQGKTKILEETLKMQKSLGVTKTITLINKEKKPLIVYLDSELLFEYKIKSGYKYLNVYHMKNDNEILINYSNHETKLE